MYMVYSATNNTMRVSGENLDEDSMKISVRGDGQWSPMPCMFDRRVSVTEALADYYQKAGTGDMIKSHHSFATFSADKRWVGDLTALQPGEGYLFRRMAPATVEIAFHKQTASAAPKRSTDRYADRTQNTDLFSNPKAATNMTMIAILEGLTMSNKRLEVYVNGERAAMTTPIDSLYFLTIQSDQIGELTFEINNETYVPVGGTITYTADSHYGTLKAPVVLRKTDEVGVYKIIENDHVVIIRNNEKYDVTGKKLQ